MRVHPIVRVYVAARFARRAEVVRDVVPLLTGAGITVTSSWLREGNEDAGGRPDLSRSEAIAARTDVLSSDAVLVLTEPDGSLNRGGGRWFEAGLAYGRRKEVVFCGPGTEIVFAHLPDVAYFTQIETAVSYLKKLKNRSSTGGGEG